MSAWIACPAYVQARHDLAVTEVLTVARERNLTPTETRAIARARSECPQARANALNRQRLAAWRRALKVEGGRP